MISDQPWTRIEKMPWTGTNGYQKDPSPENRLGGIKATSIYNVIAEFFIKNVHFYNQKYYIFSDRTIFQPIVRLKLEKTILE